MKPFISALRKKKFEGIKIEISPVGGEREEMEKAAANGDGAPEVLDKGGDMLEGDTSHDNPIDTHQEPAAHPDSHHVNSPPEAEQKSGVDIHFGKNKPKGLRAKAEIEMKKKGY